jgi:hypothetical protein
MELWIVAFPAQSCPLNASGRFKASLLKLGGILFGSYVYAVYAIKQSDDYSKLNNLHVPESQLSTHTIII